MQLYCSINVSHITPLLRQLHWLKAKQRIEFKVSVLYTRVYTGLRRAKSRVRSVVQRTSSKPKLPSFGIILTARRPSNTYDNSWRSVNGPRLWNALPPIAIAMPYCCSWWVLIERASNRMANRSIRACSNYLNFIHNPLFFLFPIVLTSRRH